MVKLDNFVEVVKLKNSSAFREALPSKFLSRYVPNALLPEKTIAIDGKFYTLPKKIKSFVEKYATMCDPESIHVCDGSDEEYDSLIRLMHEAGTLEPLWKYENCWLARTDPADVARVESKTFISTPLRRDAAPCTKKGHQMMLGKWMALPQLEDEVLSRFPGCMQGKTMFVIPFSMGPIGSPLAKYGVELTDSPYVVASMRVMTRMGQAVIDAIEDDDFVRCLHSVGVPEGKPCRVSAWPCDPERTMIAHVPHRNEIISFGSGYGGNSLLGKKCFALRIGSVIAQREGWLAEHMLILGITNPAGQKRYIAAAFPSACGKTNLAMLEPAVPGYKIECVGDDIAWMKFDAQGVLRAINPENGFFGVAPGTSMSTNPNAMKTIMTNTIYTNVAKTSDGGVYWEGLEDETPPDVEITSWLGEKWTKDSGKPAAHPNSRFCTPAAQCPIIDPCWESPEGVPIDAILFGGRRPEPGGLPLVVEAFNWSHGVFMGAAMRSEATAAAEFKGKVIMHDPFAMRPFFGYNFGDYLAHWLGMKDREVKLPLIFHVNWFRKGADGKFIWPGYGENIRVLDWVMKRIEREDCAVATPIGNIPKPGTINLDGLKDKPDMGSLFDISKEFWLKECDSIETYFNDQVGEDLPAGIAEELKQLRERVQKMSV